MWGMYHNYAAASYTVQTTYLTVNGTLGTNVDKIRLFLSTQNMSGDIRILRRD